MHRAALALLLVWGLMLPAVATAQAKKEEPEKVKLPKPEDIVVETDDVDLHCTYYASPKGKEAVPVILIHGWGGRRTELDKLAMFLQEAEHAVLVPDLRGHGDSKIRKPAPGIPEKEIVLDEMTTADIARMMTRDFVYLKNELLKRNNASELNIEHLTLVGFEFGGLVAWNWTATDWSQPAATIKLGRDVKAIALISPVSVNKKPKATSLAAMKAVGSIPGMSVMVVSGTNDKEAVREIKAIDNAIAKYHPEPKPRTNESQEDFDKRLLREKTYYKREKATTLQGVKLLDAPNMKVANDILAFIKIRIVDRAEEKDLPPWEGERHLDPIPGD
jgi:pimeloyl-ACP methyl ester carboxylesterase